MSRTDYDKNEIKHYYRNKYFDLFKSMFKFSENLNYRQQDFLIRKLYANGTIAAFKFNSLVDGEIGFANYATFEFDMYFLPEKVNLINEYGNVIDVSKVYIVDKDCVIGYLQSNKKSLKEVVEYYIDKIADVELTIRTNLKLQKIPFVLSMSESGEAKKLEDLISKVLNDDFYIKIYGSSSGLVNCLNTNAPYLIDRLYNYKRDLEAELKTFFGINNKGENKVEQLQLSEVNSNNEEINLHAEDYLNNIKSFFKRIKETLGVEYSVELNQEFAHDEGEKKADSTFVGRNKKDENEEEMEEQEQ